MSYDRGGSQPAKSKKVQLDTSMEEAQSKMAQDDDHTRGGRPYYHQSLSPSPRIHRYQQPPPPPPPPVHVPRTLRRPPRRRLSIYLNEEKENDKGLMVTLPRQTGDSREQPSSSHYHHEPETGHYIATNVLSSRQREYREVPGTDHNEFEPQRQAREDEERPLYNKNQGKQETADIGYRPAPISIHVEPKARQDVTLHLEMDLIDDVQDELEEFARLRRLGHFNAAKRYFEEHLKSCIDNAYVLDQYGQFLAETSDVHRLIELAKEYPAKDLDGITQANWYSVCARAFELNEDIYPERNEQGAPKVRELLKNWPKLDSTEFQFLINMMRLRDNDVDKHVHKVDYTAEEYGELYAYLQTQNRIWNFRDLCYGMLGSKSLDETVRCLFHKHRFSECGDATRAIQIIQEHWGNSVEDEITPLALLDVFTALTMKALDAADELYEQSLNDSDVMQSVKSYLSVANQYAAQVRRQNRLNLKSRPYLQWVVACVLVDKSRESVRSGQTALAKHLIKLPGRPRVSQGVFRGLLPFQDLIYYEPVNDEAPGWQPGLSANFSPRQDKALQMVARNARELGDVMLEAVCPQQLIYSSPDPYGYLARLHDLWLSVGNRSSQLRTHLYRYVLNRSLEASRNLRSELLGFGEVGWNQQMRQAQFMILRALATRSHEKAVYLSRARSIDTSHNDDVRYADTWTSRQEPWQPAVPIPVRNPYINSFGNYPIPYISDNRGDEDNASETSEKRNAKSEQLDGEQKAAGDEKNRDRAKEQHPKLASRYKAETSGETNHGVGGPVSLTPGTTSGLAPARDLRETAKRGQHEEKAACDDGSWATASNATTRDGSFDDANDHEKEQKSPRGNETDDHPDAGEIAIRPKREIPESTLRGGDSHIKDDASGY